MTNNARVAAHNDHQQSKGGVSQNQGYPFGSLYHKHYGILGSVLGSPFFSEATMGEKKHSFFILSYFTSVQEVCPEHGEPSGQKASEDPQIVILGFYD